MTQANEITQHMTKAEFLLFMERLWDTKHICIQINTREDPYHSTYSAGKATHDLANKFKKDIANYTHPFDISVVAVRDILATEPYKNETPMRVGAALRGAGCVKLGQIQDEYGETIRVWGCSNLIMMRNADKAKITNIYWRNNHADDAE